MRSIGVFFFGVLSDRAIILMKCGVIPDIGRYSSLPNSILAETEELWVTISEALVKQVEFLRRYLIELSFSVIKLSYS